MRWRPLACLTLLITLGGCAQLTEPDLDREVTPRVLIGSELTQAVALLRNRGFHCGPATGAEVFCERSRYIFPAASCRDRVWLPVDLTQVTAPPRIKLVCGSL